jgi:hypothetical protein
MWLDSIRLSGGEDFTRIWRPRLMTVPVRGVQSRKHPGPHHKNISTPTFPSLKLPALGIVRSLQDYRQLYEDLNFHVIIILRSSAPRSSLASAARLRLPIPTIRISRTISTILLLWLDNQRRRPFLPGVWQLQEQQERLLPMHLCTL